MAGGFFAEPPPFFKLYGVSPNPSFSAFTEKINFRKEKAERSRPFPTVKSLLLYCQTFPSLFVQIYLKLKILPLKILKTFVKTHQTNFF